MSASSSLQIPEIGQEIFRFPEKILTGEILERTNRFLVKVRASEGIIDCHLHDPGRLKELVYRGNKVLFRPSQGVKTSWSVTACLDGSEWVLTDARIHSNISSAFLPSTVKRELMVGHHRIDFAFDDEFIEVKGCTLISNGKAMFPDAPTKRGYEHVRLLRDHIKKGGKSTLMILVLRKDAQCFVPNEMTDQKFSYEFKTAVREGVCVFIPRFFFDGEKVTYTGNIQICDDF